LVSGSEEVRSRAGAQAIGAFDFLRKPFNLLELGHSVRGALGEARPAPSLSVA
jgi:DNA-binding NtrC family response regulator